MTNGRKLFAILTVALVALAAPVSARGFGNGHRGGRFDGWIHGGRPGGPLVHPDRQCLQSCQQTNRLCLGSARNDAQACAQSTCGSERQAAHDACATDSTLAVCQSAVSALRTCLQPCRDPFKAAINTCLSAGRTCRTTCANTAPPPQPDAQCVASCRNSLQSCRLAASKVALGCSADCRPLVTTAEQTCGADPRASACQSSLQAAFACLQLCSQTLRTTVQECRQTAQGCVAGCPLPTATPAP